MHIKFIILSLLQILCCFGSPGAAGPSGASGANGAARPRGAEAWGEIADYVRVTAPEPGNEMYVFARVNGSFVVLDDYPAEFRFQSRGDVMKQYLTALVAAEGASMPDNRAFALYAGDGMDVDRVLSFYVNRGAGIVPLVFTRDTRNPRPPVIAVPDFTFVAWPEARQEGSYEQVYAALVAQQARPKSADPRAFFTGLLHERRRRLLRGSSPQHVEAHNHAFGATKDAHFVSLDDTCRRRILLHLPGTVTYSSRLKYLLLCNSTVVWLDEWSSEPAPRAAWEEFWYPHAQPGVHFVLARTGADVNAAVLAAQRDPAAAAAIAHRGALLARRLFAPAAIRDHWRGTLAALASP